MKISSALLQILNKTYEPSSMINLTFRGNDLAIKTNEDGEAILLFIGKLTGEGTVKGERYARRLKKDEQGNTVKDHWELKGKAS